MLGSSWRSSNVKGNDFGTEEVISWGNVCWDLELLLSAVGVESISSPVVLGDETVLVDLEPRRTGRGEGVVNLGKVDDDWSVVVTSDSIVVAAAVSVLCVHLNGDFRSGGDTADGSGIGLSATTTDIGIESTDRAVVERETGAGGGLVDTVDPELLPCGVGSYGGSESKESDGVELHRGD
jgi:hypothetical protein